MFNAVIIVQARMTSSRFPGKSMALLQGKPVIQHVLERCKQIGPPVALATPMHPASTPMHEVASRLGCAIYAGSEPDVLRRYTDAATALTAQRIMRITGDCPFINPWVCQRVLGALIEEAQTPAYVSNVFPTRTFPKGWDCEVFTMGALTAADKQASSDYDREHVTSWMQVNSLARACVTQPRDDSDLNLCVDLPEDLERLQGYRA